MEQNKNQRTEELRKEAEGIIQAMQTLTEDKDRKRMVLFVEETDDKEHVDVFTAGLQDDDKSRQMLGQMIYSLMCQSPSAMAAIITAVAMAIRIDPDAAEFYMIAREQAKTFAEEQEKKQ